MIVKVGITFKGFYKEKWDGKKHFNVETENNLDALKIQVGNLLGEKEKGKVLILKKGKLVTDCDIENGAELVVLSVMSGG